MQTSWPVGHPQLPACYREIAELAAAAAGGVEEQRQSERERERGREGALSFVRLGSCSYLRLIEVIISFPR